MRTRIFLAIAALFLAALSPAWAEKLPDKPAGYFNDYAGVVDRPTALALNEKLAQFERDTSNQVVVAIYPTMESESSVEDYAQRVAQTWGVGQKNRSQGNGVVLLVFIAERKISIQVGYGLEGALPDAIAFDIRSRHMNPRFRDGDYAGGLTEGIDLICKAILGEYKGDGKTDLESGQKRATGGFPIGLIIFLIIVALIIFSNRRKRGRRGYGYSGMGGPFIGGFGGGGGFSGGGSGGGGGFSGFSGGGGSFGGGGSSGGW